MWLKKKKSRKDKNTALGYVWGIFGQTIRKEFLLGRSKKRSTKSSLGAQQRGPFCTNDPKLCQRWHTGVKC